MIKKNMNKRKYKAPKPQSYYTLENTIYTKDRLLRYLKYQNFLSDIEFVRKKLAKMELAKSRCKNKKEFKDRYEIIRVKNELNYLLLQKTVVDKHLHD